MRVITLAPAILLLAGCVEDLKVIRLKPDGSGTILYTRRMKDWAIDAVRKNKLVDEFTEEKARERIQSLGEVEFVSVEKANAPGWEGMTATYSFKDLTKLKIDDSDTVLGLEKLANGNRVLTVTSRFKAAKPDNRPPAAKLSDEEAKALMAGLKFRLTVEVEGTVVKCSSPHLEGAVLTVMEVDFDQLLAEETRLKKKAAEEPANLEAAKETIEALRILEALKGGAQDIDEVSKAFRKIKGFKHALSPTVTLEFMPK
jgi:hypothetical protein